MRTSAAGDGGAPNRTAGQPSAVRKQQEDEMPHERTLGHLALVGLLLGAVSVAHAAGGQAEPAGQRGAATVGVVAANLAPRSASLRVDGINRATGQREQRIFTGVGACSAAPPLLLSGAVVSSNEGPVGGVVRHEWPASGGATLQGPAQLGPDVVLPLVAKQFAGQTSSLELINPSVGQPEQLEVQLFRNGSATTLLQRTLSVAADRRVTWPLDGPDVDVLPAFFGFARVRSQGRIGASSFMDTAEGPGIIAVEALPVERAATRLFAPLIRNDFFGTTGIAVVNPGSAPSEVTVHYTGSLGTCPGGQWSHGPTTLAPGTGAVFYQGNAPLPTTGSSPLPKRCAGSATIEAVGGPVLAFVNDSVPRRLMAGYPAFSPEQTATQVLVPLFRKQHGPAQMTTGIQAMNAGDARAHVSIRFVLDDGTVITGAGCLGQCDAERIEPGASFTLYPPVIVALPSGRFGWARIESDQPVAVLVHDVSQTGAFDAAGYTGLPCRDEGPLSVAFP
jgi:hypothetical protein